MTTTPTWSPVDDPTADLLTLVATDPHPSADFEWDQFAQALVDAADPFGVINPNRLRPLVRDRVAPHRIGAFTNRALKSGLVEYTGEFVVSDDHEGRNAGRPCRVMRLLNSETASVSVGARGTP